MSLEILLPCTPPLFRGRVSGRFTLAVRVYEALNRQISHPLKFQLSKEVGACDYGLY